MGPILMITSSGSNEFILDATYSHPVMTCIYERCSPGPNRLVGTARDGIMKMHDAIVISPLTSIAEVIAEDVKIREGHIKFKYDNRFYLN